MVKNEPLGDLESLYMAGLALLLKKEPLKQITMTQQEYDACRNLSFMIEPEDGKVTIRLSEM